MTDIGSTPCLKAHPPAVVYDLVMDWFIGNFNASAEIKVVTDTGSCYTFGLRPGQFADIEFQDSEDAPGFYHVRLASIEREGTRVVGSKYLGFHLLTGSFAILNGEFEVIKITGGISKLVSIHSD